jgi:hypothetical protein
MKNIVSDLTCAARELAGLTVIILSFFVVALLFLREPLATAIAVYDSGSFSLPAALGWNLATPHALLTVPLLALIYYLPIRFFAVDRARTFGVDTSRKNYLAAARDYASVLIVTFTACASIWPSLAGGYFIPVATLTGIILAWYTYSIIVNFGGYGEAVRDTVQDLAVVMALLLIGKVIPAVFRGFTYSSVMDYFMEIGMVYAMGAGVGIITYPGKGIVLPLSRNRVVARLQSYAIAVFAYFAGIFIALLPVILLLVPVVVVLLIAMAFFAATGHFHRIEEFASGVFFSTLLPRGKGLFLVAVYSPMLYVIAFFNSMIMAALSRWTGAVELVAFLSSLHYSLWKYRKRLKDSQDPSGPVADVL